MTIPQQDERFRDSGRRTIEINGRQVHAAKAPLRADEMIAFAPNTHQIVYRITPGVNCRPGASIDFDGEIFVVGSVADPHAGDELMRRKFVKLICRPV
jgi:hypothetical protein